MTGDLAPARAEALARVARVRGQARGYGVHVQVEGALWTITAEGTQSQTRQTVVALRTVTGAIRRAA